jgi:IS30 family transposase
MEVLKMKYPTRIYYTEADKSLMWDRWEKGESLNSIGRHFDRSHSSIQNILSRTGGIRPAQRRRAMRRSRNKSLKGDGLGQITGAVSIRERPASVEDRALPGHWEGDLISGTRNTHIATLVERHTRYVMLAKINGKDTETVINALIKHSHKLPRELYKSLTWDRGSELADHKRFTLATDINVYFCDPQSPWQRGSNENTNGLLRQYFPTGTDLSVHSQAKLNAVARQLNERPRKTLQFYSPAEKFNECVASTG